MKHSSLTTDYAIIYHHTNMKAVAAFVLLVVALFAMAQAAEQKETLKGESTAYYGAYPYAAYGAHPYAYSAYPYSAGYGAYPYSAYPYSAYPYYYR